MDALADMQTQEQGKRLSEHNEREEEEQLQKYWAWVYVASMAIIWRRFISLFFKFAFQNTIVGLRPGKVDYVLSVRVWVGFEPKLGSKKTGEKIKSSVFTAFY